MARLSEHQNSKSSTCQHGQFLDHTPLYLPVILFFRSCKHFTYPNAPLSQRVQITDILLYVALVKLKTWVLEFLNNPCSSPWDILRIS